jgi:integrase
MASVARNPRGTGWQARWRDPGGRQRKKNFGRRADAQRWLDQMRAEQHRGQYIDPRAGRVRVRDVAESWAAGLGHLKESTANRYRGLVRHHVLPRFGSWAIGDVRHSDVRDWVHELSAAGLAPGTVRQAHRVLSLIFADAINDGRLAKSPCIGVKLPRAVRTEPQFLSSDEVSELVAAADPEGLSVAVLAFCGLRFGELAALKVKRVNMLRRRLIVAESVSEVSGRLVWTTPKTHQSRSVPFAPSLVPAITAQCVGKSPEDLLFTSPEGGVLRLNNWRRRVFDPARSAIGRDDVTPHDLRHTAASLAIAAGANVKAVQRMLGHASAAMTLDVYAGLFGDDLDAVALALDELVPHLCPISQSGVADEVG